MIVLLTGATGLIGSHVARKLVERGHRVHALVRPESDLGRIRDLEGRVTLWRGSMDEPPIESDLAVHLAWYTVPGKYISAPENETCLESSRRLLGRLKGRVLFTGTCFEYDTRLGRPLRESDPTRPTNPYAQSKDALRQDVVVRPNSVWLRLFYLYGPWEDSRRQIPTIVRGLAKGEALRLGNGELRRDYLHVEDVASAIVAVGESRLEGCVNIGSGTAPSLREIASILAQIAGPRGGIQFAGGQPSDRDPAIIQADNARLASTGWSAAYTLERGLRQTFEWWRPRL